MQTSPRQAVIFLALALFLLNFIAALAYINEGLFHCDSVMLAQAVEKSYASGRLAPALNGRYGLVIVNSFLYLPFYLAGQNADFATRLSSILFHSLSIVALFLFIRRMLGSLRTAFFSALLFSFAPFYFVPNTYGKEHGASIFFLLLSFYSLLRGMEKKSPLLLGLAGISFVFSVSVRESMLVTIFLFVRLYFSPTVSVSPPRVIIPPDRFRLKLILSSALPLLLGLSLLYFTYLKKVIYQTLFIRDAATVYFLGIFSPVFKLALSDLLSSIHPLLFIFSFLGFLKMLYDKKIFPALFFLSCFLLVFYFGNTSCYVSRHLDLIIIPVFVTAAYLLSDIYLKYRWAALSLALSFVLSMVIFMQPMLYFRSQYNGEKRFALYVNEKTEKNAIIIAMDYKPFIKYYGRRRAIDYPIADRRKINDFIAEINGYLSKGIPVYMKELSMDYDLNRGGLLMKALSGSFDLIPMGRRLTENFHRPELDFQFYSDVLVKIQPKKRGADVIR